MTNMAKLLKQPALTLKRKGDLEQLSKDWEEYINNFKTFLETTMVAHKNPEAAGTPCEACRTSIFWIMLVGGTEVKTLFNCVGKVTATDNWVKALEKIARGIRTDQAAARFKVIKDAILLQTRDTKL